jgi:iduronate 2-sulfatase
MAALASSFIGQAAKEAKSEKSKSDKNVLFIVVDDLNTTLGCYGHPTVKTPNIDRLADMGVQYNHAYCNYAVCGPSRSSFLTGLKPETTTILDNRTPLQSILGDRVTLPYLFKQNGFHTMSLGKVFHGPKEHNDLKAWDEIYSYRADRNWQNWRKTQYDRRRIKMV